MIAAFRCHALPLDDDLDGPQPAIPHLARSSLQRCSGRLGIACLPEVDGDKPKRKSFASFAIDTVDIAEVSTADGKPRMSVTIDRVSEPALLRLAACAGGWMPLSVSATPSRLFPTPSIPDNDIQFTPRARDIDDADHSFHRGI